MNGQKMNSYKSDQQGSTCIATMSVIDYSFGEAREPCTSPSQTDLNGNNGKVPSTVARLGIGKPYPRRDAIAGRGSFLFLVEGRIVYR
jgi:hypothetical protein